MKWQFWIKIEEKEKTGHMGLFSPSEDEETSVDKCISFGINSVDKFNVISILFFFFWRAK